MKRTVVTFRFEAATPEDARTVIEAIEARGIRITPNHTHRPRRGAGIYWDGQIEVPREEGSEPRW